MDETEVKPILKELEDDDEDFIEESISERLWGLTEMFPESLRSGCSKLTSLTWDSTKLCFKFSKTAIWVFSSTFTILILPVLFERERSAMQEQQRQQQTQMLLGPNAAVSGAGTPSMLMPPGLASAGTSQ